MRESTWSKENWEKHVMIISDRLHNNNKHTYNQWIFLNIPSLLLCAYITSEISGLTITAPMGIYAEESAWTSNTKINTSN